MLLFYILIFCSPLIAECAEVRGKIIGGTLAKEGDYPFMVSINYLGQHLCGGSIVGQRHVLTAAHCFFTENGTALNNSLFTITAGKNTINTNNNVFLTKINRTTIHKKYQDFDYDIAVIEVNNSFPVEHPGIAITKLAKIESSNGTNCTVAGWGVDRNESYSSDYLRHVNVTIVDQHACHGIYRRDNITLLPDIICAGDHKSDSCQGDSGGPLICGGVQSGIVASGVGCAEIGYPGLYTSVVYHHYWIEQAMKSNITTNHTSNSSTSRYPVPSIWAPTSTGKPVTSFSDTKTKSGSENIKAFGIFLLVLCVVVHF